MSQCVHLNDVKLKEKCFPLQMKKRYIRSDPDQMNQEPLECSILGSWLHFLRIEHGAALQLYTYVALSNCPTTFCNKTDSIYGVEKVQNATDFDFEKFWCSDFLDTAEYWKR